MSALTMAGVMAVLKDVWCAPKPHVRGTYREVLTYIEAKRGAYRGKEIPWERLGIPVTFDDAIGRVLKDRYDDTRLGERDIVECQHGRHGGPDDRKAREPITDVEADRRRAVHMRVRQLRALVDAGESSLRRLRRELYDAECEEESL